MHPIIKTEREKCEGVTKVWLFKVRPYKVSKLQLYIKVLT